MLEASRPISFLPSFAADGEVGQERPVSALQGGTRNHPMQQIPNVHVPIGKVTVNSAKQRKCKNWASIEVFYDKLDAKLPHRNDDFNGCQFIVPKRKANAVPTKPLELLKNSQEPHKQRSAPVFQRVSSPEVQGAPLIDLQATLGSSINIRSTVVLVLCHPCSSITG